MVFTLFIERKARDYLKNLPPKSRRIITEKILELEKNPFPGDNKEKLEYPDPPAVYRLHISRSFTVLYLVDEKEKAVKIEKIMTMEKAHKEYHRR